MAVVLRRQPATPTPRRQKVSHRAHVLRHAPKHGQRRRFALAFFVLGLPFIAQFVLANLVAIALGGIIGDVLGAAAALRDCGLVR